MERVIGAFEARRRFGQLIEEAYYKHDRIIVERSGRPMAAIIPIEDYERFRRLAKSRLFGMLEQVWEHNADVPTQEVEKEVEDALAALKAELRAPKAS